MTFFSQIMQILEYAMISYEMHNVHLHSVVITSIVHITLQLHINMFLTYFIIRISKYITSIYIITHNELHYCSIQ